MPRLSEIDAVADFLIYLYLNFSPTTLRVILGQNT